MLVMVSRVFQRQQPNTAYIHRESKKTRHKTLGHNFTNYYPIFKIFSLADSVVNLQQFMFKYSTTL